MMVQDKTIDTWELDYTGEAPSLCVGDWILKKNGVDISSTIPFDGPANTYGTYSRWFFGEDNIEQWETYEDGLSEDEWILQNIDWLKTIADERDFPTIYKLFQGLDFRYYECGGCI